MNYKNIFNVYGLANSIIEELERLNIACETELPMPGFAILVREIGWGEFNIAAMCSSEVKNCTDDEIADLTSDGWCVCEDLDDIIAYARSLYGLCD